MLRINFQLKQDIDLSYLSKLLPNKLFGNSVKIQRFISERLAIERHLGIPVDSVLVKGKENELFKEAYKKMDDKEKSLFNIWQLTLPGIQLDIIFLLKETEKILKISLPGINFVSPERTYRLAQTPNDPLYATTAGEALRKMSCEAAWMVSQGDSIVVAVIDSGLELGHPDIDGNILQDAQNHIVCRTFINGGISTALNDVDDVIGHGTHMSGIIAAEGDNSEGLLGVAPKAKILPIKAFDNWGNARSQDLAQALYSADTLGAHIINNSWFYDNSHINNTLDAALFQAIQNTIGNNVLCVFAAGNGGMNMPPNHWLFSDDNMIVVAATTLADKKLGGSNGSSKITIAAPGEGIVSLGVDLVTLPIDYPVMSGTSPASAHVCGALALYLSRHGGHQRVHPSVVIPVLRDSKYSDYIGVVKVGKFRINCEKLVHAP